MSEVAQMGRGRRKQLAGLTAQLTTMTDRVKQVVQTPARIFDGNTKSAEKLVSVFEPQTEIIRKGKASKPTEFSKMVKVQEAENQIVTAYEVYDDRSTDSSLLFGAVELHEQITGTISNLVAADAGFYSQANEKKLEEMGVKNVSIPNRQTRSEQRRKHQKKVSGW